MIGAAKIAALGRSELDLGKHPFDPPPIPRARLIGLAYPARDRRASRTRNLASVSQ